MFARWRGGCDRVRRDRFQLLPDVVDPSLVLSASGAGGLIATAFGAGLRFGHDRIARLVMLGNLGGGAIGIVILVLVAAGVL
jgi:hypothetical protein